MSDGAPHDYDGKPFRAARKDPPLKRVLPISGDLRGYGKGKARGDLIAALTVAAVAVPAAMGYAELAGLSPVVGGADDAAVEPRPLLADRPEPLGRDLHARGRFEDVLDRLGAAAGQLIVLWPRC